MATRRLPMKSLRCEPMTAHASTCAPGASSALRRGMSVRGQIRLVLGGRFFSG